jgi:hypothetical protein
MLDGSGTSTAGIFPLIMVIPIAEILMPMTTPAHQHEELWKHLHAYDQELCSC